ncbi:GNAT family N-acetyltransferase [Agromyces mariniharenae]|uniref:GNAT family N-acetyltransferase n=2 Tax=Agromyces mariniharenae TaxID=2604423 RepID=A0A5S4V4I4_9MICO|nr:GNAT family N-acetyltransferase [Agromyces mariniharenae]
MPPVDRVLDLGKRLPDHSSIVPSIRLARYAGGMPFDPRSIPVDPVASAALARHGLEYRLLDPDDHAGMLAWIEAENRGFHHGRPRDVDRDYDLSVASERRVHGVYDPTAAQPETPVATVDAWPTGLSVPGGRSVDAWAVSAVTVSPTHRRRGIARALMEGELANARAAGAAVAMLTATEATIYGRFGFAPAAKAATITVDRRRTHWVGPDAPGRVHFVAASDLREAAPAIARRAVARTPGEIDRWPGILDRALGLVDPDGDGARSIRAVRYDDEHGQAQGFAAYRITREPNQPGFLEFDFLVAATDDAERALWRFLIEQDFVTGVRARLRSVDEPLPWLLEDPRAVSVTDVDDHLWVRILDPIEALRARRYGTSGTLVLDVSDVLGHARGRFRLTVDDRGRAEVEPVEGTDAAGPGLRLGIQELGAIYLGGVRPSLLARAARITETAPRTLVLADRMFASERTPHLSIWF